jgi:hypothetical protein
MLPHETLRVGKLATNVIVSSTVVVGYVAGGAMVLSAVAYAMLSQKNKGAINRTFRALAEYYSALYYFWVQGGTFRDCPHFPGSLHSRCHVYSLSIIFSLWSKPHYRNGTFQDDMVKNLRDVALPGTGIPLSTFAHSKILTFLFIVAVYPACALVAALNAGKLQGVRKTADSFVEQLVAPQDWFSFWRLNCRIATLHAGVTGNKDYRLEDKWEFLLEAERKNVAVTPYMKMSGIVCKHRNEEGGLGFESFKNASVGGDWIIQRKLDNGPFLKSMLPKNAPLSTFRIISASRGGLRGLPGKLKNKPIMIDDIQALSCVWRAGRTNAKTDHSAILFNVHPKTGEIKRGTTNVHWYQRGFSKVFTTPWVSEHNYTHHPDNNTKITGNVIPNMKEMMDFVRDAHLRLIPHVPLCGWDVAFTENDGMLLLEGNFSCNFFRGDFDQDAYFEFIRDYFVALELKQEEN